MNLLTLSNIKENQRAGLFLSVVNRTSSMNDFWGIDNEIRNLTVINKESKCIRVLKKCLHKRVIDEGREGEFLVNNLKYQNIVYNINLFNKIKNIIFNNGRYKDIIKTIESNVELNTIDLIQAHWAYPIGYVAKIIKQQYNIPYVLTVHGSDIHTRPWKDERVRIKTIEALESADKVIFVSEFLINKALELGYSGKNSIVIPNGVDNKIFKPMDKNKCKRELKLTKKVIGFVGNLVWVKRADRIPEIFKFIQEKYNNVEFLLIGDGEFRKTIENKCEEYNLNVKITGKVQYKNIPKYMNAMDILILPSRREGWGSVILEAFSCGIPVIGSCVGGIPQALGNLKYCVTEDENFEERFANKVVYELINNEYSSTEIISRSKEFSWNNIGRREYELYKEILRR